MEKFEVLKSEEKIEKTEENFSESLELFQGEECDLLVNILRSCLEKKIAVKRKISRNELDGKIVLLEFNVAQDWLLEFKFEENGVVELLLNEVVKYKGENVLAGLEELSSLIVVGLEKKEVLEKQLRYRTSIFRIKYLEAFKRLFKDENKDKFFLKFIVNNLKIENIFSTNGIIRSIYKFINDKVSIDIFDDDSCRLCIDDGNVKNFCFCKNIADCIGSIYSFYKK